MVRVVEATDVEFVEFLEVSYGGRDKESKAENTLFVAMECARRSNQAAERLQKAACTCTPGSLLSRKHHLQDKAFR